MARFIDYAIARFTGGSLRDERLNVALLIFLEGALDVRVARRLGKVRAITLALDPAQVQDDLLNLVVVDDALRNQGLSSPSERRNAMVDLGLADLSALGRMDVGSSAGYEFAIESLLRDIVEPEQPNPRATVKRTRLLALVKRALKRERVLARQGDDLHDHRVVPNVILAEGLTADLVLKNGAMHVVETIDASGEEVSPRKVVSEIALSALVLEQARITYGETATKAKLVYEASVAAEAFVMPSLRAAEHQGADLVNWRSRDDQVRFIDYLASMAKPLDSKKGSRRSQITASTQRRFNIN